MRTVSRCRPNTRETSRMLIPSTITARRTRRYTSTWYIHRTTHKHDFEPMDGRGRYIFQPPQCQAVNPSRWSTLAPPFTEDTVGASPVRHPGASPAQRMGIHPLGKQWGQHLPQLVGYLKGAGGGVGRSGWAGAGRSRRFGLYCFRHSPTLAAHLPPSLFTTRVGLTHF